MNGDSVPTSLTYMYRAEVGYVSKVCGEAIAVMRDVGKLRLEYAVPTFCAKKTECASRGLDPFYCS